MILALSLVPIAAGLGLYALPRRADEAARWIAVAVAGAAALVAAAAASARDESWPWLARPFAANFHFSLGRGPSFWLAELLCVTTLCALVAMRVPRGRDMSAQMLLLLGAMMGVFISRDLLVFALYWDLMLIPVFMILIGWAPSPGAPSAWKYLIYNLGGGLVLLLAVAGYGAVAGTTDVIGRSGELPVVGNVWGAWIFWGIAFAFLVKTPIWPFHTWMPLTYGDLPAPAVAVVSAVQSKAGLYGFLVIGLPLFAHQMRAALPVVFVISLIALVYGALAAIVSNDLKRIVAYSSLSHLGLVMLGIFAFPSEATFNTHNAMGPPFPYEVNSIAAGGALVYMIAHGLFSAALFIAIGLVEAREDTRSLERLGGMGGANPRLSGALLIAALAALGLPGLGGFAGELLILSGVYQAGYVWAAAIALVPIVLAAGYMLRLFQGTMQGPPRDDLPRRADLGWLEGLALAPLVIAIVWLGIDPSAVARATQQPAGVAFARAEHVR